MMDKIVLDIEICEDPLLKGWDNTHELGVSCACLFEYRTGQFRVFGPDQLQPLWQRIHAADRIVGFNVLDFDLPVIFGVARDAWHAPDSTRHSVFATKTSDILQDIWQSLPRREKGWKLGQVAQATLGRDKPGDGAEAPKLFKAGRWAELIDYCLVDVALTRDLHDFIERHNFCVGGVPERVLRFKPR